jgi:hypothetical protein
VSLAESVLLLRSQLESESPTPETMKLLKAVWAQAGASQREALLTALGEAPSEAEVQRWRDDDQLHLSLLRQWRWLAGIADELPKSWADSYSAMTQEFGEGDNDARRYMVQTMYGSPSAVSARQISTLGPDGLVDWLRSWEPPPRNWGVPTPAGMAGELSSAVQESPDEWMAAMPGLVERLGHPTYVRAVLGGFREAAATSDYAINWDRLLPAIRQVVNEPWDVKVLTDDPFDADRDWSECYREVLRLLQQSLDKDADLSDSQLTESWDVLTRLMRVGQGGDPSISGCDLLTHAINKQTTIALHAMFSLVLSASRRERPLDEWRTRLADAVREELDAGGVEALLGGALVASLFPQFLHISGDQAIELVPVVFGSPEPEGLSTRTLETLVKYARPITNQMLSIFYPYLETYFTTTSHEDGESERSMVRWLVIGHLRVLPGQEDPGVLVDLLSGPDRISEAAEFYGRVLREDAGAGPGGSTTALRFWDEVLSRTIAGGAFMGFGWWSEGDAIPDDEWLPRIFQTLQRTEGRIDWDHEVVERLSRLGQQELAWKSLALLVGGATDRWSIAYWAGRLQEVLEESGEADEPIRTLRVELVEKLLQRELLDFRRYIET